TLLGCENMLAESAGPGSGTSGASQAISERPEDFSSTLLPGVSLSQARTIAVQVLREHFRLDAENSTELVLRSHPTDTDVRADGESKPMNEVLSGRTGRRRQWAEIVLVERGPDVLVRCQVGVQRQETAERSAFAPMRGGDDRPAEIGSSDRSTAIETRGREVWKNVGRDRQLEHAMLEKMADRTAKQ
ncbi:MAG: hypothetical protein FWC56_04540, partial [Phycisphaerae bacterium]|nr:hypothetical protein [Phycisphaerae bacterium]